MHPDLYVLIDELKLIKSNDNIDLTHGEIRSFIRAFVAAADEGTINPFHELSIKQANKVILYLNLTRAYGIPHSDRSRVAAKCLEFIESIEDKSNASGYPDEDWSETPQ